MFVVASSALAGMSRLHPATVAKVPARLQIAKVAAVRLLIAKVAAVGLQIAKVAACHLKGHLLPNVAWFHRYAHGKRDQTHS